MLFKKQLRWEISNTTGAVFLVLLTIIFIFMMIKALGNANSGNIAPQDIILLMSLSSVLYLPHIIIGSVFIATIMVLTRWYETSEMTVWQASGLPLISLLMPLFSIIVPFVIIVTILSTILWPWSNSQIEKLKNNFKQRDEISFLVSGQFFELEKAKKVLFIEQVDTSKAKKACQNLNSSDTIACKARNSDIYGIFVTSLEPENIDILSAANGTINEQNGQKYAILNQGNRYISSKNKIQNIAFKNFYVKIKPSTNQIQEDISSYPVRAIPTSILINSKNPEHLGELSWRIGIPIAFIVLQLWALVLSHANPRRDKYFNIVLSVVVYIVYNNLLSISQVWIEKQQISFLIGSFFIHTILFIIGMLLLLYRTYGIKFLINLLKVQKI